MTVDATCGVAFAMAVLASMPAAAGTTCDAPEPALLLEDASGASLAEIVERIEADQVRYVFVGERHGVGPVKRFAVDLANRLVERGVDVGLYVEGFRTNCPPADETCWSIARAFNREAFHAVLEHSLAPVHPLDPPENDGRAARMAATIAAGTEGVRIVLVGRSHVAFAQDPAARYPIFGGALDYPDPGDLVEAFPREHTLTLGLEVVTELGAPYRLRAGGCGVDYSLFTEPTGGY